MSNPIVILLTISILLLAVPDCLNASEQNFVPLYPSRNLGEIDVYKTFLQIVEAYNMNVTVIVSLLNKRYDNAIKESVSFGFTWPVNNHNNKPIPTLDFLSRATNDKLVANIRRIKIDDQGSIADEQISTNKKLGTPQTEAYKLVTKVTKGRKGFTFETESNFIAMYKFVVLEDGGRNRTTKVLFGKDKIDVTSRSGFSDEQVAYIKKILYDCQSMYHAELAVRLLLTLLERMYPGIDWQVAVTDVGSESYLAAKKHLKLTLNNQYYLIFSI